MCIRDSYPSAYAYMNMHITMVMLLRHTGHVSTTATRLPTHSSVIVQSCNFKVPAGTRFHSPRNWQFYRATLCQRDNCCRRVSVCLSVSPSVRLSQAGVVSKRLDESSWFWQEDFLPPVAHCAVRKFQYLQKLRYLHLGVCPKLRT